MTSAFIVILACIFALVTITCSFIGLAMKKELRWSTIIGSLLFSWAVFGYMIVDVAGDILYYYTL
ncbi:hypothetical protein [Enterobacter phage vB_EcRAM-01]|nr:hypothetical protein [Enterobacter phage vB_EcRAM-01]